jgi:hypothetical protein
LRWWESGREWVIAAAWRHVLYEPARFRGGGVGTDQLQKVWPRSQRYSRYCLSSRELPVGDAGAWQKVQRRPLTLMCAPYSQRALDLLGRTRAGGESPR